ncbi:hypothetical protein SO802_021020 [Lithocarpus litseifolius]|uniref:Uncharacterized protein n=1 Tax=Lithocarpus litseifolius TaxID=425828 RepID=A0AAW2CHP6_9ROSI
MHGLVVTRIHLIIQLALTAFYTCACCGQATEERHKTKGTYIILEPPNFSNQKFLTFEAVTPRSKKEKTGHSPSRIELFGITHVQADGQVVNEPTQDALVALRNLGSGMLNCVVISLEGKKMTPMICKVAWVTPLYV